MKKKINQWFNGKVQKYMIISRIVLVVIVIGLTISVISKKSGPEIISKSSLEKIINVSDLSTFEAVYNGIAKVMNADNTEEVDYYVSYDAKVKAGIDFEKVNIMVDDEKKIITVKLPEVKINEANVDITSLDYIFVNDKANTSTVSEEAYKKCIEDLNNESSSENAIYELAEKNAHNIIEALLSPFIEQLDDEYKLQID